MSVQKMLMTLLNPTQFDTFTKILHKTKIKFGFNIWWNQETNNEVISEE